MQNRRRLVAELLGQRVHKPACNFTEIAELDDPDGAFLPGNSPGLDLRLCGPHPMPRFQHQRARIDRIGRSAQASVLVEDRIHLRYFVWSKRPCQPWNIRGYILMRVIIKVIPVKKMELRIAVLPSVSNSAIGATNSFDKGVPE